jgi:FkbM family methyltransferase
VVEPINKIAFKVDPSFNPSFWEYLNAGKWEAHTFNTIDSFVHNDSVAIDLGCWIGPLSLYIAGKGARVFSIDPDPVAYREFIRNIDLNPELKALIHPTNIAITENNDTYKLYARSGYGNSSSSILNRTRDAVDHTNIKGIRFEQFIEQSGLSKIDFIKIDIEGGEFKIMDSIIKVVKEFNHPTILLSIHYYHLNESIYQKKIGGKFISLSLMKLEKILGFHLFKNNLIRELDKIVNLAGLYPYIYDQHNYPLDKESLTSKYLLKNQIDLLFTSRGLKCTSF